MFTTKFTNLARLYLVCTILLLAPRFPALAAGCDLGEDGTHCYVSARQVPAALPAPAHGIGGLFTEPNQLDISSSDYSIGQLSLSDTSLNYIEFGWVVRPSDFGDPKPHLFITLRYQDNPRDNCNIAAYPNLPTCAKNFWGQSFYVQLSQKNWPGSVVGKGGEPSEPMMYHVGHSSANECDGQQGWWIQYGDEWIGCVKDSWWLGNFVNGTALQWQGEAVSYTNTCIPMGNGKYATYPDSARVSNMFYEIMNGTQSIAANAEATTLPSDWTQYWKADLFEYPPLSNPKGYYGFHYGGPYGGNNGCVSALLHQ